MQVTTTLFRISTESTAIVADNLDALRIAKMDTFYIDALGVSPLVIWSGPLLPWGSAGRESEQNRAEEFMQSQQTTPHIDHTFDDHIVITTSNKFYSFLNPRN
jgi:hypothetical protein